MTPLTLSLPWPPSVNDYWGRNKWASVYVKHQGQRYREAVCFEFRNRVARPIDCPVAAVVGVFEPNRIRRDLDNFQRAAHGCRKKGAGGVRRACAYAYAHDARARTEGVSNAYAYAGDAHDARTSGHRKAPRGIPGRRPDGTSACRRSASATARGGNASGRGLDVPGNTPAMADSPLSPCLVFGTCRPSIVAQRGWQPAWQRAVRDHAPGVFNLWGLWVATTVSSAFFYRRNFGITDMTEKLCLKCRTPLTPTAVGRPSRYCSTGCRRAAEFELRRLQRHLERLERQRETPLLTDLAERAIDELEARLRTLLGDEDRAIHNRYR